MVNTKNFIYTSDFATIKNDDSESVSIVIPASITIPAGNLTSDSVDVTVGASGTDMIIMLNTSITPDSYFRTEIMSITRTGTVLGTPTNYDIFVAVWRSGDVTTLFYDIINPSATNPLVTEGISQTITAKIRTFIPPFA